MSISETVLRLVSRDPAGRDYFEGALSATAGNELALLKRDFGALVSGLAGKRVVDFGCGEGRESVALVLEEGCFVCGIDTNPGALETARALASSHGLKDSQISFCTRAADDMHSRFDIVISQNSMEHFPDPEAVIAEMKALIHRQGKILVSFGPPWFAPYGSHMHFFCRIPWVNIVFSERSVMAVRGLYRNDGAKRYEEVESGLNRMTVAKFERITAQSGLVASYRRYRCVRSLDWLAKIPGLRELFINRVVCVLERAE